MLAQIIKCWSVLKDQILDQPERIIKLEISSDISSFYSDPLGLKSLNYIFIEGTMKGQMCAIWCSCLPVASHGSPGWQRLGLDQAVWPQVVTAAVCQCLAWQQVMYLAQPKTFQFPLAQSDWDQSDPGYYPLAPAPSTISVPVSGLWFVSITMIFWSLALCGNGVAVVVVQWCHWFWQNLDLLFSKTSSTSIPAYQQKASRTKDL